MRERKREKKKKRKKKERRQIGTHDQEQSNQGREKKVNLELIITYKASPESL